MACTRKCPVCDKAAVADHDPFCSEGCRNRDLLNWLGDGYRIAGPAVDSEALAGAMNGLDSDAEPGL